MVCWMAGCLWKQRKRFESTRTAAPACERADKLTVFLHFEIEKENNQKKIE